MSPSSAALKPPASTARARAATIQITDLSVVYGDGATAVRALNGVSLEINGGEFFTLLGPSGCGKTTLLRCIAGFEVPSGGSIRLDDQPLDGLPPYRRPVNTVFQSYALFPHLTVAQNIAFSLEERRAPREQIAQTVERMLSLVKLEGYGARKPGQLSGGQQQRVALARALAGNPRVLLLDESLSALDLKLRQEMRLELKRLQRETGITFVFVTHDQDEALTMSDRIAVMRAGNLAQIGTPAEIYDHPRSKYVADFIGDTNFLSGAVQENRLTVDPSLGVQGTLTLATRVSSPSALTVAVRPERLSLEPLSAGSRADLSGRVTQVIYMGSETMVHVGDAVRVRVPNTLGAASRFRVGDAVAIHVPADSVQPLEADA
jgi:spermidine/putrescine transport system ATP-binding protein